MPLRAERPFMPGYGVDGPQWSPLPWSWASERLVANRNFWIVTVAPDGRPHAMPVWAVWNEDEERLAFSCAPGSRKARNLVADPRAVATIDDTVECLSIEGLVAPVPSGLRHDLWVERYLAKYQPLSSGLDAEFLGQNLLLEFVPERAFAVIEREDEFATRATRWVFALPSSGEVGSWV